MKNYDKLPLVLGLAALVMLFGASLVFKNSNFDLFNILSALFAIIVAAAVIWYNHFGEEHKNDILD
ncbi:hypothetical protein HUU53_04375 [Candidatus Micrarchaeota archaeon]|nr:hypothetical protein [Candidatus Micrarchaeota archaeon]